MTQQDTPLFGAMTRRGSKHADQPPSRLRKARWLGFLLLMQAFHTYPLSDLVHRHYGPGLLVPILLGQAVFAALWVRTTWLAFTTTRPFAEIRPWLAGVVLLGVGLALVVGGGYKGVLIYVSIACAVTLPLPATLWGISLVTLVDVVAEFRNRHYLGLAPGIGPGIGEFASGLCLTFFLGLMMWFYRRTMMLIIELRQAREELARLAVTEERLRFARDLHDLLGHSLSTISLKSQLARRLAEPDSAVAQEVADIESVARQALAEVREAVTGYRQRTLAEELTAMRGTLREAGIEVSLEVPGPDLPDELDRLLAFVVREGGTNVLRHSQAHACAFRLRHGPGDAVSLDICDDGVGVPADGADGPVAGNGLVGLAERVAAAGGRLASGPAPGHGFRLSAELPLVATGPAAESPVVTR